MHVTEPATWRERPSSGVTLTITLPSRELRGLCAAACDQVIAFAIGRVVHRQDQRRHVEVSAGVNVLSAMMTSPDGC